MRIAGAEEEKLTGTELVVRAPSAEANVPGKYVQGEGAVGLVRADHVAMGHGDERHPQAARLCQRSSRTPAALVRLLLPQLGELRREVEGEVRAREGTIDR